jgi:RHS repeat-associated protein
MLGSNRATLRNGVVTDWRDYYCYGAVRDGATLSNGRWLYLGKEFDGETATLHLDAREYDPFVGFTQLDPLWAKYPAHTPYHYGMLNPFKFADPEGLDNFYTINGILLIERTGSTIHNYYTVSDGNIIKLGMLAQNDKGLVKFPDNGLGFRRYGGDPEPKGDHYVTPEIAAALFGVAYEWSQSEDVELQYGDMSDREGHAPRPAGVKKVHNTHKDGQNADIRPIRKDGDYDATSVDLSTYDWNRNQKLANLFGKYGFKVRSSRSDSGKILDGVEEDKGPIHKNHHHLKKFSPRYGNEATGKTLGKIASTMFFKILSR